MNPKEEAAANIKPVRRTRLEKLMDARIAVQKAANHSDIYTTNRLPEGIDYLFFEIEMLIREVAELKRKPAPKKLKQNVTTSGTLSAEEEARIRIQLNGMTAEPNTPADHWLKLCRLLLAALDEARRERDYAVTCNEGAKKLLKASLEEIIQYRTEQEALLVTTADLRAKYETHDHEPCMYCDPLREQLTTAKSLLADAEKEIERLKTGGL